MTKEVTNNDIMEMLGGFANDMNTQLGEIRGDIAEIKTDIVELKDDVAVLKSDVAELKHDVAVLKSDMVDVKSTLAEHTIQIRQLQESIELIAGDQKAHFNDIMEIYSILRRIENKQEISDKELKDAKKTLAIIVAWAQDAGEKLSTPLKV